MMTWLPRWRTRTNPCEASSWQTSRPEKTRSLGNAYLDRGYVHLTAQALGDFGLVGGFEEELHGLDEIRPSLLDRVTLARDIQLRAQRHEAVAFALNHARQLAGGLHEGSLVCCNAVCHALADAVNTAGRDAGCGSRHRANR